MGLKPFVFLLLLKIYLIIKVKCYSHKQRFKKRLLQRMLHRGDLFRNFRLQCKRVAYLTPHSCMVSVCALGYSYGTFFEENLFHKNISQEVQKTDHEFHSISFVLPAFTCCGFMLAWQLSKSYLFPKHWFHSISKIIPEHITQVTCGNRKCYSYHLSTMMNYTPILKRKYLWKTISLLSFLCSGRFSTSFDPKVQFSLFTLQTILLLGFKSYRGFKVTGEGASLVAQWLRIRLPMQGTRVRALVWEDPTCRGATKPVSHNYWACAPGACAPQQERLR